jgi:hypothetical protein
LECGGTDAALAFFARNTSQSGVAAMLCHRTPKNEDEASAGWIGNSHGR